MSDLRILTVQDISCVGQCSLTVALPILSACGIETAILPSAVLSTHTAGFSGYTVRDLTDDMPAIAAHWKKEGLAFDAFYTGYLGSARQIDYVQDIFATLGRGRALKIVDPAMADQGKLYPAFDLAYVEAMKPLCRAADVVVPNITEAALLTGLPYRETYDEGYVAALLDALEAQGIGTIVLTGVGYRPGETGVAVRQGGRTDYYPHRYIAPGCHGTGDVYASALTGALLRGLSPFEAAKLAADFTVLCIEKTQGDPDHWYGVKFEKAIPALIQLLDQATGTTGL